jgi:hypothetical protein
MTLFSKAAGSMTAGSARKWVRFGAPIGLIALFTFGLTAQPAECVSAGVSRASVIMATGQQFRWPAFTSDVHGSLKAVSGAAVAASVYPPVSYTMQLSSAAATVPAGAAPRTTVSFHASRSLYDTPVDLSVSGLPSGVTASFFPPTPLIGGSSVLLLSTAPSSGAGTFTITVNAILTLDGGDPIGTSTTFDLTINAP